MKLIDIVKQNELSETEFYAIKMFDVKHTLIFKIRVNKRGIGGVDLDHELGAECTGFYNRHRFFIENGMIYGFHKDDMKELL